MTSRLDRLFLLLETGSTSVTRKAAAKQLGEVQRLHPHELNNLLAKVRHYLHSSSWDTRIAASQAVEAIVSNVPLWLPSGIKSETQDTLPACTSNPQKQVSGRMSFSQFDINTVIKCGHNLLASEGKEYDESQDASSSGLIPSESDLKEKLAVQRQQLNQKLGLDVAMNLGLDLDSHDFVSNEDLANDIMSSGCGNDKPIGVDSQLKGTQEGEINEIVAQVTGRSVKRKLKSTQGKNVVRRMSVESDNGKDVKKSKLNNDENSSSNSTGDLTIDTTHSDEWLLEGICDELMYDLFNANWEVRHGAATALREIIKLQGKCGGRTKNGAQDQMDSMNQLWLEDLALRLTCVLALDKFGDFVSDQVVAPVRETCAQSLGLILNLLTTNGVNNVLKILLQLLSRPEWEARHGGLLGIKYLLAIRKDLTRDLLPIVFQPIFDSLKDSIDDVSAVAAAALIPIKDVLIDLMPDKIPIMIDYLWDSLLDLDDLSSSTGDLLMLLSSLLTFNSNSTNLSSLTQLVPRLWPFLSHSLSSVRKSVLESLLILTTKDTSWITSSLLADALRLLFQRCLFEHRDPILLSIYNVWYQFVTKSSIDDLLLASCPHLSGWICLMMHPSRVAIDPDNCPSWMEAKSMNHHSETQHPRRNKFEHEIMNKDVREKYYLGGSESLGETAEQREIFVIRARIQAAKAIGLLASRIAKHECLISDENSSPIQCFANVLLFHLNSKSAIQRMCIGWTINEWAKAQFASDPSNQSKLLTSINDKCLECLQDFLYFDEISSSFTRLQHETRELVALMSQHKLPIDSNIYKPNMIYTLDQISSLVNTSPDKLNITKIKPKIAEQIECKTKSLSRSLSELTKLQSSLNITVQSSLAGAIVSWKQLPLKLNPIVRPLMDSIKSEENEQLQQQASKNLVDLMRICCDRTSNSPSPIPKIIKNLISYLCCDCNFTPNIELQSKIQGITLMTSTSSSSSSESSSPATSQITNNESVILTLEKMLKLADKMSSMRRSNSITAGKKSKKEMGNSSEEVVIMTNQNEERQNEIIRRGASQVLSMAAQNFAEELPAKLEHLWEQIIYVKNHESNDVQTIQNLINSLQVLEVTAPYLNSKLHADLIQLLPHLCLCLESQHAAVRHMSSRCIGMLSEVIHQPTMDMVLTRVIQLLEVSDSEIKRQGAIETIYCVIEKLGLNIVPYIVLLIVPMLGRMSDQNHQVRSLATNCFAQLVQLFPLDSGNNNSDIKPEISDELLQRKESERHFLEQLMNMKNVDNYEIPVAIKAELRSYQKDGVNWLAFLSKYKLHGIVADEMGLGKTLQTICILASDHFYRGQKYDKNKNEDCKPLMSIAICPPTLTGHWVYEVQKFISEQYLHALHYTGPPNERTKLRNKLKKNMSKQTYNLVIASYDIVRNDIEFFSSIHWNYCILDEGHVIKNGKTKLSKAIKSLSANHRLILTGTPIQNNVIELWSLFDFLMPGLLGTERQFMAKYSRPILQSRDAKSSSKEQEAGVLAMESLHRQVLPFILRRMKEDVLSDLPPKIMQDYYCELSSLQSQLYEDFAKSRANQTLHNSINSNSKTSEKNEKNEKNCSHIFQALQYLRKVCNHPKLVLTPQHPQYDSIVAKIKTNNSSLSDINHASKLCALKQLLMDCGIGTQTTTLINGSEPVVNQHRALVFFQLKSMLDIVEFDLFKAHMPSVSYLRLDGSIPPSNRHSVVHRFNNDPSIDVLLLTTQVGGLGLNLTGADTVIFVEHDWNPMKDLQAMDRAHRIGQKKVVNVYRLITTGTLEEKIMGLQKFKLTIANTVISSDNSSLQTMATEQLLDLFNLDKNKEKNEKSESAHNSNSGSGIKNLIENLPELWENEEYESEYDLDQFMSTLKS